MPHPVLLVASQPRPFVEIVERHDTLRTILEWLADRFADVEHEDTSIAWEDGEDHEEPRGPATL